MTGALFDHLFAPGTSLLGYQDVGIGYGIVARRVLIADQMGLGKTLQALGIVAATRSWPLVVICPPTLRGNWVAEVAKFLPDKSTFVVHGEGELPAADVYVVGYSTLDKVWPRLAALDPQALVFDEAHRAKSTTADWTRAALALSGAISADKVKLALTGTPLVNRAEDLITQLELIDRLVEPICPTPRVGRSKAAYRRAFKERYGGDRHLLELNGLLRSVCYVRRERDEVPGLGLSATTRVPVVVSLEEGMDSYRKAEADFIRWLYDNDGAEAARRALRVAAMAKMGHLRHMAGVAKLEASVAWVEDFLESNPDKSLVVFAWHQKVQRSIAKHFGCATILGGQSDHLVQAAKETFQAGKERVIVLSLQAASEGHTLTRASDVLFAELPWTASHFDQAADRCNRLGQPDKVHAWYLLAEDTIDQRLTEIIEQKRGLATAGAIGRAVDETEDVVDSLIESYGVRA